MSYQAQTAVTYHSQQNKIPLLRLLMVFAEKANSQGAIDPAPNQDTLAEIFSVSARTIRSRIKALIDSGELIQTRVGSGPGNASAYQINLPLDVPAGANGGSKVEENPGIVSTLLAEIHALKVEVEALKVEVFQAKVEDFDAKGGKGGSQRWKVSSFKSADDPSLIHIDPTKGKDPPPPPTRARARANGGGGGGGHPLKKILVDAGIVEPMLTHLLQKDDLTPQMAQIHLARAPTVAAAIHRMRNGWPVEQRQQKRQHVPPEYENVITR